MFVLNIHKLLLLYDPPAYGMSPAYFGGERVPPIYLRAHSFLTDPRTAPEIRESVVDVHVRGPRPKLPAKLGCAAPHTRWCEQPNIQLPPYAPDTPAPDASMSTLKRGATNEEVLTLAHGPAAKARVIRLSDAEGVFSGCARCRLA